MNFPQAILAILFCYGTQHIFRPSSSSKPPPQSTRGVDREMKRRIQHSSTGVLIALMRVYVVPGAEFSGILFVASVFLFLLHVSRLYSTTMKNYLLSNYKDILREDEAAGKCPGAVWFTIGTAATFYIFDHNIALLALLHLSFGDPAASFFGKRMATWGWGGWVPNARYVHGKSLHGFLGCFMVCVLVTRLYIELTCGSDGAGEFAVGGWSGVEVWVYSIVTGLVTALVELDPVEMILKVPLNDNLAIPIISGYVMSKLRFSLINV